MNLLNRRLFIMHDRNPGLIGAKEVTAKEAKKWNEQGYGVFWCVNDFDGPERRSSNLTEINACFFEIDGKSKSHQLALIEQGLYPSLVVESKNSYHVYFFVKQAEIFTFEAIQKRLISFYSSDQKIRDPLRLLRAPGFQHLKDPSDPFDVRVIWSGNIGGEPIVYSAASLLYFYPEIDQRDVDRGVAKLRLPDTSNKNFDYFDQLYNLDHLSVLQAFSGTKWVNGEVYTFKNNRNGKHNISVNGKPTHCFIDKDGRIGAVNGGPTIWQWLKWFGHDKAMIKQAIKEVLGV